MGPGRPPARLGPGSAEACGQFGVFLQTASVLPPPSGARLPWAFSAPLPDGLPQIGAGGLRGDPTTCPPLTRPPAPTGTTHHVPRFQPWALPSAPGPPFQPLPASQPPAACGRADGPATCHQALGPCLGIPTPRSHGPACLLSWPGSPSSGVRKLAVHARPASPRHTVGQVRPESKGGGLPGATAVPCALLRHGLLFPLPLTFGLALHRHLCVVSVTRLARSCSLRLQAACFRGWCPCGGVASLDADSWAQRPCFQACVAWS